MIVTFIRRADAETNLQLCGALEHSGLRARPLTGGVFEVSPVIPTLRRPVVFALSNTHH